MRRNDDGHVQRPPPFRVLAAPTRDTNYLSPSAIPPPPPRAPEPYKIAPSSTSYARAHRRSSFVIIAETRPSTPDDRSPSPTLATGRVSPFRGRGFKGPPPRSKSRPQSPENTDGRRRSRLDRRVSVSQQSSPRRSLIPQPTRQRSTSLTKTADRRSSPKIGRRADSRTRLNLSDSRNRLNSSSNSNSTTNLFTRRQLGKVSAKLSPIQGTPTKPEKNGPQSTRRDRTKETTRISPTKTRRTISPTKNTNAKKVSQEKSSSKERLMSPSKIPLKTSRNGTMSLNPARFITIPNQPGEKGAKKVDKESRGTKNDDESSKEGKQTGNQPEGSSKDSQTSDKTSSTTKKSSELDLTDLLKRSSNAIGTSSVVNTTTATAVQPLHIEANTVLIGKDDKRSPIEAKNQTNASTIESSNSSASNNDISSTRKAQILQDNIEDQRQPITQVSSKPPKATTNYNRTKSTSDSRNNSPVPAESMGGHSKNSSLSQSQKNMTKTNSNQNGTGSATQRSSKNQSTPSDANIKSLKSNDQKPSDDSSSMQSAPSSSAPKSAENESSNESNKNLTNSNANGERINLLGSALVNKSGDSKGFGDSKGTKLNETEMKPSSGTMAATNSASMSQVMNSKTNSLPVNSAVVNDSQNVKSAGGRGRNGNRESNVSLKSSAGVSTDSIESIRSTDTGVSVNTVRGVSSPREKTGVHVVKRTQEIETLSGNVMHLEQNGEPAVLAAENGVEEQHPERLLTRWKKSLGRYCQCCPSMRCLACRRDSKGLSWPKKHAKIIAAAKRNEVPLQEDAAGETAPTGCWTKFKSRCRCTRFREIKCCSRKARVAPAEATACCPPERRFGAICRRLFDRCKCRRAETERTRSIRAKHSLTSVAPPPLSEEPKCKIPDVLVEHNSLMRGAIPCLPVPLAWFCLVWNVLLPGSGTVWSGIFNLCTGQPRFSPVASLKSRLGAFVVNLVVGVGQLFTVLFCLVGWGWSIWWGVTLIRLARKYKRFKASEAANNDPEARGGDQTALPPGVPSQALRGMERAR